MTASGAGLTYQWRKGGSNIGGATGSSFVISSLVLSDAGNYDVVITDPCGNTVTSNTAALTVSKANQTIASIVPVPGTSQAYGATFTASASAPGGTVAISTSGGCSGGGSSPQTITMTSGTIDCTILYDQAGNDNYNFAPQASVSVTAIKAPATVTLTSLSHTWDGSPKAASASTNPSGLTVILTYNGSAIEPSDPGSYAVVGTIDNPNYQGSESGALTITDTTAPNLVLSMLPDGATTLGKGTALNISGIASDVSGIATLSVNGTPVIPDSVGRFSYPVLSVCAANIVTVSASDTAGNVTTMTRTTYCDKSGPLLTVTWPADNGVLNQTFLDISGTSGASADVAIKVNEDDAVVLAGENGAFTASLTLAEGMNTVVVTATEEGKSNSSKRTFRVNPAGPALAIETPPWDATWSSGNVTIAGTVSDISAMLEASSDGGATFAPLASENGSFNLTVGLPEYKTYQVVVRAVDSSHNATAETVRNIIRVDDVIDPISFAPVTDAVPGTVYESAAALISGIDVSNTRIAVTGGEYALSTDGGASWSEFTAVEDRVSAGTLVKVRLAASAAYRKETVAKLTVGWSHYVVPFSVTTLSGYAVSVSMAGVNAARITSSGAIAATWKGQNAAGVTSEAVAPGTSYTLTATSTVAGVMTSWSGCDEVTGNGTETAVCTLASLSADRNVVLTTTKLTVALSTSAPNPQKPSGVTFIAQVTGGSGSYEYQWEYAVGGVWTTVKTFSSSSTLAGTELPGAGTYTIRVTVRNQGGSYCALKTLSYQLLTENPITAVKLTASVASPHQAAGVTFNAAVTGGSGSLQYQWQYRFNGVWYTLHDYGSGTASVSATELPLGPGIYTIKVLVRNVPSMLNYEKAASITYTIVVEAPASGVTITKTYASPHAADGLTFTATVGSGSGTYEYKWMYKLDGTWVVLHDYDTGTAVLPATELPGPGTYSVQVMVRNAFSPATYEALKSIPYTLM